MSFNLEDPLAGILSDGSDDSFFDDDILGKKKPTKKKTTPLAEKKNALFDLGAGANPKPQAVDDRNDVPTSDFQVDKPKSPTTFTRTISKESIKVSKSNSRSNSDFDKIGLGKSPVKTKPTTSAESLDILGNLIPETKKETGKPLERGKSTQSLLDDILGGSSKTGGSSQPTRPVTAAKSQEFDFDSFLGKSESKQTLASKKTIVQKPVKETKKEPTNKTKTSGDWLGIFQKDEEEEEEVDDSGMPAWLAGGDTKKKKTKNEGILASKPKRKLEELPPEDNEEQCEKEKEQFDSKLEQLPKMATSNSVLQGSIEDITTEGATLYLQQQEAQLMVALQLKAQDEKLAAMQMRQKDSQRLQRESALAHHAQLDAMLARQAEHRRQMQAVIAAHQDRITQRIQALLGTADVNQDALDQPEGDVGNPPKERQDSPHAKEKRQLLQLVQSLQENHDKEIDLMETSYRRQLAFLEVSVSQSEERMKDESDKLIRFYSEKLNWLEEHHSLYKKLAEDNLNSLTDRHKSENEMLRQQHLDNIRVLQEHHASLLENIKNAVKQEHSLIHDSAGFSSDLHELVTDVKESKSQCILLVKTVQAIADSSKQDSEKSLQIREKQIDDLILQLKKERENFDSEKSESRDMVKMLESRLKQMTSMIEDETTSLKQKRMEFEFEKATFSKQTEFAKNVLKRQDDEIKMLKEDIQKEYKEKISTIEEEKQKALKDSALVAKEKASTQSLKQEIEKLKTDLQAQLEEVTEERSRLNVEKQQMHMEEQRILAKSRDLDLLAKTAIEQQSQANKKYSEAEFIQRKYEERIRRIQEHVVSLNNREKQIAKEKVALSRERLNLHNERKQMEGKQQCSLCKSVQGTPQYNFDRTYLPETFLEVPVSKDFGGIASSAMNAIEQEMAHLMGQGFNLKHTPGLSNFNREGRQSANDRGIGDESVHPTQVNPETFKDFMDPKFMMLRLDVQQVINNLDQNKTDHVETAVDEQNEE